MNPTHIPGANRVLTAPRDWDAERNGPCDPLPVIDTGEFFQSAWIPDPVEIDCMQAGAPVIVTIWGRALPPHSVSTMPKPGYVPADAYRQAHLALRNLLFMVRTSRSVMEDAQLFGAAAIAERVVGEIDPLAKRDQGDKRAQEVPLPPDITRLKVMEWRAQLEGVPVDSPAFQATQDMDRWLGAHA
jgi:hypothetical protein